MLLTFDSFKCQSENEVYNLIQVIYKMFLTPLRRQRLKEAILSYTAFLLTPAYFLFQLCVIRPYLTVHLDWGPVKHFLHIIFASYLFTNVVGNMILCVLTDTRVKSYHGPGSYCEFCRQKQPANSWHCKTCNTCILRRDHHCILLARCIGRNNLRYFICYLCHLTISMIYATYYNYIVLRSIFDLRTFAATTSKIFNLADWSIFAYSSLMLRDRLFICFWYLSLIILPISLNLSVFHLYKAFKGLTWYEYKKGKVPVKAHWKRNITYIFGTRWYLALFWPTVASPLPNKRTQTQGTGDLRPGLGI
ncbi:probable palmitoyltransferase ZDHHC24 [Cydia pomonella]|uniref:probable palmitoyltransferase ZDHHC24 n=1 Tax=Cydia pomonella TaxID=82600 RepID=UPI002ADE1B00|nr:probable palmitoyltransferase ZDHHC24 [Cydia pomonella]